MKLNTFLHRLSLLHFSLPIAKLTTWIFRTRHSRQMAESSTDACHLSAAITAVINKSHSSHFSYLPVCYWLSFWQHIDLEVIEYNLGTNRHKMTPSTYCIYLFPTFTYVQYLQLPLLFRFFMVYFSIANQLSAQHFVLNF